MGAILDLPSLPDPGEWARIGVSAVIAISVKSQQYAIFIVLLVFLVPSSILTGLITPVSTESPDSMLTSYRPPRQLRIPLKDRIFARLAPWGGQHLPGPQLDDAQQSSFSFHRQSQIVDLRLQVLQGAKPTDVAVDAGSGSGVYKTLPIRIDGA